MPGTFRSPNGSPGLPPRLRVPPTPPYIHRKLQLSYDKQGLLLYPEREDGEGLRVRWGATGGIEKAEAGFRPERYVPIAGVLGIVQLWDSRHLLVISPTESSYLFPSTTSKEVFTIRNVMAIRLDHADAKALMDRLCNTSTGFKWPFRKSAEEDIPKSQTPTREELEEKIIAQIEREYESGGFIYAYDFDLSRSIQSKPSSLASLAQLLDHPAPPDNLPLWRRVDKRFWWNEHLVQPFIEGGHHAFVLPVIQGVAQATTFNIPVPSSPEEMSTAAVDFAVVSRRSRERAGLRYQRRGIDDDGHVANFCETEMIVRATVEQKESVFSFVQIRGSIPLKWSQKPWSTKPPPVLDVPVDQTYSVAALHFDELKRRYGKVAIVNLSEQTGKEAAVTNGYGELVEDMDDLTYTPFDFHAQCKGMKWEKISTLVEGLDFDGIGYTWVLDGEVVREQAGAFRTNCIDCLDRTNVVQSAIARHVLTTIFTQLGMLPDGLNKEFNGIWANNGDVLSICYARTSALKGDFVRTGKRDLAGMLHDGISSINRIISGAFADFFAQAVINFMLGQRGLNVFSEFLENMTSMDAASLVKLSRVRAAAVETSSARVLEGEQRLAGWTLLSPENPNEKISAKLEEKIVLLTPAALYLVSFNYSLDKVQGYTRVPLGSITKIEKGPYILSPLQEAGRDPVENAGFVIHFSRHQSRYSSYSMSNGEQDLPEDAQPEGAEYHAFKVLPREFSSALDDDLDSDAGPQETCRAVADRLVARLQEECVKVGAAPGVEERDIVSIAEAQASIPILRKVEYFITRALWL